MIHKSLPYIIYVKVTNDLLGPEMPVGFTRGILHGIYCREGQVPLTHILLESGAHWSGIPLHLLHVDPQDDFIEVEDYKLASKEVLIPWGGMGKDLTISYLEYLEGLKVSPRFINCPGRHTGIIIDWDNSFAKHPQEHKPLSLIHLVNGQLALLPNNYYTLSDPHFTKPSDLTAKYRRGDIIFWER